MANASDSALQALAEQKMTAAEATLPPDVMGDPPEAVDPDVFWESLSERTKNALRKYRAEMSERGGPPSTRVEVIRGAATQIKGAAQAGLDPASSASSSTRDKLKVAVASAVGLGLLASLTPLLVPLLIFLAVESSGFGRRARSKGRSYISAKARSYGF